MIFYVKIFLFYWMFYIFGYYFIKMYYYGNIFI